MGWGDRFRRTTKTERVLIVALAGGHYAHASQFQIAAECDAFSRRRDHRFVLEFLPITYTPQELARNAACKFALERLTEPDDTLLMVDHDMITHGWKSLRILDTPDYDVAGSLQYMWIHRDESKGQQPEARPCVFLRQPDGARGQTAVYPQPGEDSRAVDRVGSGFMAIKRRVLADPRMLLAPGFDPPALWETEYERNYIKRKGLDINFCDRAKALGFRVIVNWQAQVGHHKHADIYEVDEYAKQQFVDGFQVGVQRGLQMAAERGGAGEGPDGSPGRGVSGDGGVDPSGLDRAVDAARAAGA